MRIRRPSPAVLIAVLALFVALGGSSYAALQLPKASVGTTQLKKNAVTSPKVKRGSLLLSDFKASQRARLRGPRGVAGPQGLQGPQGIQGPAGAPATRLWARVTAAGGSIVRGSGTTGVVDDPAELALTGVYRIYFDRDVSGCVSVASIAITDGGQPPAGQAATNNSAAFPNAIVVATYNGAGTAVSTQDFNVAVFC